MVFLFHRQLKLNEVGSIALQLSGAWDRCTAKEVVTINEVHICDAEDFS